MNFRVLLGKENNQKRYIEEVDVMEDHKNFRIGTPTWLVDDVNIVKYLRGPCKLNEKKISSDLIQVNIKMQKYKIYIFHQSDFDLFNKLIYGRFMFLFSSIYKINHIFFQKILGILEVNVFEARTTSGNTIRCLYPKLGIIAHSCVPNTAHSINASENFK